LYADQLGTTQTIKEVPGVTRETNTDSTNTITINLSEVDESKLPEKYNAKVVLEAPIIMAQSYDQELDLNEKVIIEKDENETMDFENNNFTPDGTFLCAPVSDGYPDETSFDVSINKEGKIYIMDILNGRIQEFDSNGKHINNIPVGKALKMKWDKKKDHFILINFKNEIATDEKGELFIRDKAENKIEQIKETGEVKTITDLPEKFGGENMREKRMTADKGGVVVGGKRIYSDEGDEFIANKINERKIEFKKGKSRLLICQNSPTASSMKELYRDYNNNIYLYMFSSKGKESGIIKISETGELLSVIKEGKYLFGHEWMDSCGNKPSPLLLNWERSMKFDLNGNLYFLEMICCKNIPQCANKIRILKLEYRK
jgi:hypothetical protein